MKRASLVFLSVLVLAAFFPRQAAAEVTFDLGIKGGISFAKTAERYAGEDFPSKALKSPAFGVFAAFNLNKSFTLQPEVYLLTQGGIWEDEIDAMIYKWKHVVKYIHVPLLAKLHLVQAGSMIPIIFAGPSVDLLLSANEKFWLDGVLKDEGSFKEDLKSLHFGAIIGGGVEFMMDKLMVILEVRYNLGLIGTLKDPEPGQQYKYKTLMILAGVGF